MNADPQAEIRYLEEVNTYWNQFANGNESDQAVYGVSDYWATPQQTLESKKGDCDDIAIGKVWNLLQAGYPQERVYLGYVLLIPPGESKEMAHMVAMVEGNDGRLLVMDNLMPAVTEFYEARNKMGYHLHYRIRGLSRKSIILNQAGNDSKIKITAIDQFKHFLDRFEPLTTKGGTP